MKKNLFSDWTIHHWLVIFISSLTPHALVVASETVPLVGDGGGRDAEAVVARQEFQALRQELAAVVRRAEAQQEEYLRLQLHVAALIAGTEVSGQRATEAGLLAALADTVAVGREIVDEVVTVCRMMDAVLDEETITPAERARIRARLAGLRTTAERFGARIRAPEEQSGNWDSCRILAVDDRLQVAVIAAGSVHGVGGGLGLRVGEGKDTVRLRVIAVRPHVSAALVVEGDLSRLAPGMLAQVGERGGDRP